MLLRWLLLLCGASVATLCGGGLLLLVRLHLRQCKGLGLVLVLQLLHLLKVGLHLLLGRVEHHLLLLRRGAGEAHSAAVGREEGVLAGHHEGRPGKGLTGAAGGHRHHPASCCCSWWHSTCTGGTSSTTCCGVLLLLLLLLVVRGVGRDHGGPHIRRGGHGTTLLRRGLRHTWRHLHIRVASYGHEHHGSAKRGAAHVRRLLVRLHRRRRRSLLLVERLLLSLSVAHGHRLLLLLLLVVRRNPQAIVHHSVLLVHLLLLIRVERSRSGHVLLMLLLHDALMTILIALLGARVAVTVVTISTIASGGGRQSETKICARGVKRIAGRRGQPGQISQRARGLGGIARRRSRSSSGKRGLVSGERSADIAITVAAAAVGRLACGGAACVQVGLRGLC